jgi:hypothetical protein
VTAESAAATPAATAWQQASLWKGWNLYWEQWQLDSLTAGDVPASILSAEDSSSTVIWTVLVVQTIAIRMPRRFHV